jgi:hypothetical protein
MILSLLLLPLISLPFPLLLPLFLSLQLLVSLFFLTPLLLALPLLLLLALPLLSLPLLLAFPLLRSIQLLVTFELPSAQPLPLPVPASYPRLTPQLPFVTQPLLTPRLVVAFRFLQPPMTSQPLLALLNLRIHVQTPHRRQLKHCLPRWRSQPRWRITLSSRK